MLASRHILFSFNIDGNKCIGSGFGCLKAIEKNPTIYFKKLDEKEDLLRDLWADVRSVMVGKLYSCSQFWFGVFCMFSLPLARGR